MSEHWAFYERCHRWYYADRASFKADRVRCPVCDAVPEILRTRPVDPVGPTS